MKTKEIILVGLFAAVMAALSVITVPIGTIPITLGVFAVFLTALILPKKQAVYAVLIYILLGAVGIPVFSGMRGGVSVLLGATGGYIWSYPIMAWIIGTAAENKTVPRRILVCMLAVCVCYLLGTVQYHFISERPFLELLMVCAVPFIPFDLLKAVAAVFLSREIQKRLNR